ncbi:hypothetical protein PIB30_088948 [Stylosanthes scabra]|uniref:Uncharacterized protein n=1 Tax=Stylosanthes scabra TaxID=79078 RepID=A0ABU6QU08_9FABA|nr:hypothetical protein [Stylosanthes scabra]
MSSLKELDLWMCKSLRKLPEFGKCMNQLSILSLGETAIEELPTTLGNLVGLSELDISGYDKLRSFPNIVGVLCSLSSLTYLSSLKLWGCIPESSEESTFYYNLGRLSSLTYLDLSENQFARVPMIIHELPRLTRLRLYICHYLEVLSELPSSLRELDASCCGSLNASYVNDVIPKMCRVFLESARQDDEEVLQVLIPREEIPAWFDHQEQGSSVSIPFPHNCPSTETIALALCFLLHGRTKDEVQPSVICNGKEFIKQSLFQVFFGIVSPHLFVVYLTGYYFSSLSSQENRFQMLFPSDPDYNILVQRSAARWEEDRPAATIVEDPILLCLEFCTRSNPPVTPIIPFHSNNSSSVM